MEATRKHFSMNNLIQTARNAITYEIGKIHRGRKNYCDALKTLADVNSAMAALAMFSLKFPSMLQFDRASRDADHTLKKNLKLFGVRKAPCDTTMRERLDVVTPCVVRSPFTRIFTLLQRARVLENFAFLEQFYLISLDATGYFSSHEVHCDNCCKKHHKDGSVTYYHQMFTGALVHPDEKVVFPFAPEMIMNNDGSTKNDCERNACKRWLQEFRREHPILPIIVVADGLHSNKPLIDLLKEYNCHFIIVCGEDDHQFLTDWVNSAAPEDSPEFEVRKRKKGKLKIERYKYMKDVPLSDSGHDCRVNVVQYQSDGPKGIQKWMWITDLEVTKSNVPLIAKGGRARWKIENETFNTLKNQGYHFEHNYGHGYKNLSIILACLMLIAFFIDQCLQYLNKNFQAALHKCRVKAVLWERMRVLFVFVNFTSLDDIYEKIANPKSLDTG